MPQMLPESTRITEDYSGDWRIATASLATLPGYGAACLKSQEFLLQIAIMASAPTAVSESSSCAIPVSRSSTQ